MVIIDRINMPSLGALIPIAFIAGFFVIVGGYAMFNDGSQSQAQVKPVVTEKKQSTPQDMQVRQAYEQSIAELSSSFGLKNLLTLASSIMDDRIFLRALGWELEEMLCVANVCNSRFKRTNSRVFEYVALKKEDASYEPLFNQDQISYENVNYPIGQGVNLAFSSMSPSLPSCNAIMTELYQFNTLLSPIQNHATTGTSELLTVSPPTAIFDQFSGYAWAEHRDLKVGKVNIITEDSGVIGVFEEKFANKMMRFDGLSLLNQRFQIDLSYFCI